MKEQLEGIQKLLNELKITVIKEQRYEHAAQLRNIEKKVIDLIDTL